MGAVVSSDDEARRSEDDSEEEERDEDEDESESEGEFDLRSSPADHQLILIT